MKINYTLFAVVLFFVLNSCQAIDKKSQEVIKKENEKFSKFIQQPESELKIVLGKPDKVIVNDNGSEFYVYLKKNTTLLVKENLKLIKIKWLLVFLLRDVFKYLRRLYPASKEHQFN